MQVIRGKGLEEWKESFDDGEYASPYLEKTYIINTKNGILEIINPVLVCEISINDTVIKNRDKEAFVRFVIDTQDGDIVDIPLGNIIYIREKHSNFHSCFKEGE